jgi:uncharacterized membrane protein
MNLLGNEAFAAFLEQVTGPIEIIRTAILVLIMIAAIGFAIWVGIRLAKAEDEGKRKEAKQQLLWSLIAAVAAIVLLILMNFILDEYMNYSNPYDGDQGVLGEQIGILIGLIVSAFNALLNIASIIAVLFAVYIASKLALAQDEGKRKEAKKQLLWTLIAVVGTFMLAAIIQSVVQAMMDM